MFIVLCLDFNFIFYILINRFPYKNWNKVVVSGSNASLNSLTVSNGITGSLLGTASYATQALSASYATNALSASFAQTASYATYAANGGVTKILAGANVNLSPVNGLGDVTVTSFGTNLYNTATGSYGSFYDTGSVLATSATAVYSMSLNTTDISNGVSISASNGDNTRVKFTNAGTYNLQFSSQFSNTDNSTQDIIIWVRKNGVDIPDSSGVAAAPPFKAGSNGQVLAAWNYYLSLSAGDFIQMCWHVEQANVITLETIAAGTSPTHPRTPSTILTATRVDTFLSNTGSFSGSFTGTLTGTASYATQALSASSTPNALVTASVSSNTITFTKGDGTTFPLTVNTGSGGGGGAAFPFTGSAQITGSLGVTGSINNLLISTGGGNVSTNISIGATTNFSSSATGAHNFAAGNLALSNLTTGAYNTAIGNCALRNNTTAQFKKENK